MTRETYIKHRHENSYPLCLYYDYFKIKGGELSEQDFNRLFLMINHILSNDDMVAYYDNKYELVFTYGSEGKLLKIS